MPCELPGHGPTLMTAELPLKRLPITIGVTGHINIHPDDAPRAKQEFIALLEAIHRRFPHSPLRLLTSLAEGSDRLAAHAFLEFREKLSRRSPALATDSELIAVLPLPRRLFEDDFPTSVEEFRTLLATASDVLTLPVNRGLNLEQVSQQGPARDTQYASTSRYVSTHCNLLVALWDAVDPQRIGGTADTVRMRLLDNRISDRVQYSTLARALKQPLHHIKVNRTVASQGTTPSDIFASALYSTTIEATLTLLDELKGLDDYNKAISQFVSSAELQKSIDWAFSDQQLAKSILPQLSASQRECLQHYAAADALSAKFEKRWRRMTQLIYGTGLATAFSLPIAIESILLPWSFLAYAVLLGLAAAIYGTMKAYRVENRHTESRALAELLRVQFAWLFSNLEDPAMTSDPTVQDNTLMLAPVTHLLLGQQQRDLGWMFAAVSCLILHRPDGRITLQGSASNDVVRDWIEGQRRYFSKKGHEYERRATQYETASSICLFTGIACAIGAVIMTMFHVDHPFGLDTHDLRRFLVIFAAALPICAIVFESAAERFGYEAQAKIRFRLLQVYETCAELMEKAPDTPDLRDRLVAETGKEAVFEAITWLFLRRIKPVKVSM